MRLRLLCALSLLSVCQAACMNGGVSSGGGTCSCPVRYTGSECESFLGAETLAFAGDVALDDAQTTASTLDALLPGQITDVAVTIVDLAHASLGELSLELISPEGTAVALITQRGASAQNLYNVTFTSSAARLISNATAPFSGDYQPESSLSILNGENPVGDWILQITDSAAGNTGHLRMYTISITSDARDHCASSPCANGAACTSTFQETYACNCSSGYVGAQCTLVDPCLSSPCVGEASCYGDTVDGSPTCSCPSGFTGALCESELDPCASNPCAFSSTCLRHNGTHYTCVCTMGFSGPTCALDTNECASSPCHSTATCATPTANSFTCLCPATQTGPLCETTIDHCDSSPCQNDGTCSSFLSTQIVCQCSQNFTGSLCETSLLPVFATSIVTVTPPPSYPIQDHTITTLTLSNPIGSFIRGLTIQVSLTHSYTGDLKISVKSPGGIERTLFNRRGSSGNNLDQTVFSDLAANPISSGSAPFLGVFRPEQPLSVYYCDADAKGDWVVLVRDLAAGDSGEVTEVQCVWELVANVNATECLALVATEPFLDSGGSTGRSSLLSPSVIAFISIVSLVVFYYVVKACARSGILRGTHASSSPSYNPNAFQLNELDLTNPTNTNNNNNSNNNNNNNNNNTAVFDFNNIPPPAPMGLEHLPHGAPPAYTRTPTATEVVPPPQMSPPTVVGHSTVLVLEPTVNTETPLTELVMSNTVPTAEEAPLNNADDEDELPAYDDLFSAAEAPPPVPNEQGESNA